MKRPRTTIPQHIGNVLGYGAQEKIEQKSPENRRKPMEISSQI
jgi:hypothetical protein